MDGADDALCQKGVDSEENRGSSSFKNQCREHDTVVVRSENPYDSHCASHCPDHAEIKCKVRQMELMAFLRIKFVPGEMKGCARHEKDQKDDRNWQVDFLVGNSS